jgi:hypothetical protein
MLAACPMMYVATGHGMKRIVSTMPRPALTLPPGLLTYMLISALGSSLARNRSCATTRFAIASETPPPRKTMRSFSRRL